MLKQRLSVIKSVLLQYNTYFNNGFDDVFADEKGIRTCEKVVFPNDTLGDYFYIRLNNGIRMSNTERGKVIDCAIAVELLMSGYVIAVVKGADSDGLIENITNTLMWNGVAPTGANWNKEEVIRQEMRGMAVKDIEAALQRVNSTIISVSFDYRGNVNPIRLNCMENPCSCSG